MAVSRISFIAGRGPGWSEKLQFALVALAGGVVLAAALVFSIGLALLFIPLAGLAYLFRRPLMRAGLRRMGLDPDQVARAAQGARPDAEADAAFRDARGGLTIETDYRVVEPGDRRQP